MSDLTPEDRRALDRDELDLVEGTLGGRLTDASDRKLSDLVSRLRERRNRARDMGNRQARSGSGNAGTRGKEEVLALALRRAMDERTRRAEGEAKAAGDSPMQAELSRKALEMKREAEAECGRESMKEDGGALHPNDPDADPGKKKMEYTERNTAPSGALDHAGELPSRERSRTRY